MIITTRAPYALGDRVLFTYRTYDESGTVQTGMATEIAKVTRVWDNGKYITIKTGSGKTFTRDIHSDSVRKD